MHQFELRVETPHITATTFGFPLPEDLIMLLVFILKTCATSMNEAVSATAYKGSPLCLLSIRAIFSILQTLGHSTSVWGKLCVWNSCHPVELVAIFIFAHPSLPTFGDLPNPTGPDTLLLILHVLQREQISV